MSELTREQVELELMQLLNGVGVGGNILAHDAAIRAKGERWRSRALGSLDRIEQLEKDCNHQTRQRAYAIEENLALKSQLAAMTAERDGQAMQIDALRTHLSATITDRDRLKKALQAVSPIVWEWISPESETECAVAKLMDAALRGETGDTR